MRRHFTEKFVPNDTYAIRKSRVITEDAPVKGDSEHSFIKELHKLIDDKESSAKRTQIIAARKAVKRRPPLHRLQITPQDEKNWGVKKEFITGKEAERSTSGTYMTVDVDALERILKGLHLPSEQEIISIAFDFGLSVSRRKAFIKKGDAYIEHCKDRHTLQSEAAATAKKSHTEVVLSQRNKNKSFNTAVQAVLAEIVEGRGMEHDSRAILLRKNYPHRKLRDITPTALRQKFSVTLAGANLLQGNPPSLRTQRFYENALAQLLITLQATPEETQRANEAFMADIAAVRSAGRKGRIPG